MKIDLLNSEGGIVIASIVDGEVILSFHGTKETQFNMHGWYDPEIGIPRC
jgi:hypothetical protein